MIGRPRFRYSPWDGTQRGFELDALDVMEELTDDLLYHGDVSAALRRALQEGFADREGNHIQGLRELLDRLREERRQRLEQYDLGGVYDDIAQELREVVELDRTAIDEFETEARDSGDARRAELTEDVASQRRTSLDLLPPDLAGQVKALSHHDFTSDGARERFEGLVQRLREQLLESTFNQMAGAMSELGEEELGRMKDMLAELNSMLDARSRDEDPDFDGFMDRFGDFFPENPRNLDELLEIMAARMAAMSAMLASMSPEQRAQLQQLSDQLLEDLDLRWQMDQLGANLRQLFPDRGWDSRYDFSGFDPLDLREAAGLLGELGDLDQLEQLLRGTTNPGALRDVDLDRVRDLLGGEAAASLDQLQDLARQLEDAGMIENREGRLELTPAGIRRLGQNALGQLFRKLERDGFGQHEHTHTGAGHERAYETKPFEWGDELRLDIQQTIRNAIVREAAQGGRVGGPVRSRAGVRLSPEDFEVERTEDLIRSSTVLMLDLSLSMPMRDNFLPAKKVAMALYGLITMQFPRDYLGIVTFSEVARTLRPQELPEVSWDFVYGTNMQHGFQLSRQLLARQSGTKQIIMITDGEPTAHINRNGHPEFHYPPVRETVDATLTEVMRCTRDGIRINTFMLDPDRALKQFIERLTELNRGRAFFTSPETLGDFVLVDFLEHKRELLRGRGSRNTR